MEVKPSSVKNNKKSAQVTFENREERYRFGAAIPLFRSRESWRQMAYMFHFRAPDYDNEECYPRTVNIPYTVLGQAVVGLALSSYSYTQVEPQMDKNTRQTILEFLHDPDQSQLQIAETATP